MESRPLVVTTTVSLPADVLYRRMRVRASTLLILAVFFAITPLFWYSYTLVCAPIWTLSATLVLRHARDIPGVSTWISASSIMSCIGICTSIAMIVEAIHCLYDDDNYNYNFWNGDACTAVLPLYVVTAVLIIVQAIGCGYYLSLWKQSLRGASVLVQHHHVNQYASVAPPPNPYQQAPAYNFNAPPPSYTQQYTK
eukprot:m.17597 g.17597  ORF g.17597 m.17597 type:complete len:196 (+) comp4807_c0_seq2:3819-4406(+)